MERGIKVGGEEDYIPEENQLHLRVGTQELQERYRLSSAPKIGKRCPMGTEKCRAPRGNKNRGNRGIKFEKTEQLLPFGKQTD